MIVTKFEFCRLFDVFSSYVHSHVSYPTDSPIATRLGLCSRLTELWILCHNMMQSLWCNIDTISFNVIYPWQSGTWRFSVRNNWTDNRPRGSCWKGFFFYLASFTAFIVSCQSRSDILVGQLFTFWNSMGAFSGQSKEKIAKNTC